MDKQQAINWIYSKGLSQPDKLDAIRLINNVEGEKQLEWAADLVRNLMRIQDAYENQRKLLKEAADTYGNNPAVNAFCPGLEEKDKV